MIYLKTNTAVTLCVGPFVDKTDGITPETALTVSNCKITLVAETDDNSAPTLVLDNVAGNDATNTLAHITNDDAGYYSLKITAANVNRLGRMKLAIMDAVNHCPVFHELCVLPTQVYDSLILGTDLLDSNASQLGGTTQTGRDLGASVLLSSGTGAGQISLSSGAVLLQATQTGVTIPTVTTVTNSVGITATAVDNIWDEVLTGGTHNVISSAGRRLRQIAGNVVHSGTAQGAGVNGNQIILDAGASAVNGSYDPSLIAIVDGAGIGQCRLILQYEGATRTATVDRDWKVQPDITSEFIIYADAGREHVNEGLAQAGGASSITLNVNASSLDDNYVSQEVFIRSGTGQDQARVITAYNGTTKVATVSEPWGTIPDTTSGYVILPTHVHELADIASSVWASAARTLTSGVPTVSDIDAQLSASHGAGAWGGAAGSGSVTYVYNVTDSLTLGPLPEVEVTVYSDSGLTTLIASGETNAFGNVTFFLDPGTYYFVSRKAGYSFTNPDTEVVA